MANIPEKNEIKKAIQDFCIDKSISVNELTIQSGISGATLSNIINDKWANIADRMWLKIWHHVHTSTVARFFDTTDYAATIKLCEQAKNRHYMIGLIADYGMGKTTSLKSYSRNENVFYIYYDVNMKPKDFFYELGKQMGYDYDANVYSQVKRATETLNSLKNPLIIVDESSKLTDKMLMTLHVLRDKTINNCGIVLAGMPYFKSNLVKHANKQKIGISEFLSRVMIWHELSGLSTAEIELICSSYGITDKKELARFKSFRKFRDLANEILLYQTVNS